MHRESLKAVIREDECIGCTKCIQACPADAILGSMSLMHTVIADECIGCQLCVAPCPVDCIDMVVEGLEEKEIRQQNAKRFKMRYEVRKQRLNSLQDDENSLKEDKKAYLLAALERARLKKK